MYDSDISSDKKKKKDGKATIRDVARLAGVATGTVSHALNNVGYVNEKTREKVLRAVAELGYVPNRVGRALKTTKTGLIMMAIPDTSNEIYFDMIRAVREIVKEKGYSLLLYYTDGQHAGEMQALQMLKERVADALFMVHFSYEPELLDEVIHAPGPVVLCGMCNHLWVNKNQNFDTISIDVYQGIYSAVKHLNQLGHKKIGYLAGKNGVEVYRQRYQAYRDAFEECGIQYREDYVLWNDYSEISGYNAGRTLFQMQDRPTAICASNDQQAIGCWQAIHDLEGHIPQNMALSGLDNLKISRILGVTSLDMKEYTIGEEAAKLLMQRLDPNGEAFDYQNVYLRPELVVRESTIGSVQR